MNVNLHIERLILDGLPVAAGQDDSVQTAVESELTRLLTDKGFNGASAYAVQHLSVAPIQLRNDRRPSSIGHQVGRAIYGCLISAGESRRGILLSRGERG